MNGNVIKERYKESIYNLNHVIDFVFSFYSTNKITKCNMWGFINVADPSPPTPIRTPMPTPIRITHKKNAILTKVFF